MAMQSTEGNVLRTEVLWFVSALFNDLSWFVTAIFNVLSWFVTAIFNALSWLVSGIRNVPRLLIFNIAQRVSLCCNSTLRPMTIVRLFGAAMILATFSLFNSSLYLSSLDTTARWTWRCCILVQVSLMLPFPRTLKPMEILQPFRSNRWCASIPYDALKAVASVNFYYVFELLGSTIKFHNDPHLMCAYITFFLFLIIVDLLYDVEEAIKLCDGYIFAGYGIMLEPRVGIKMLTHITCLVLCFLNSYLRSNRENILTQMEPTTHDIPLLPVTTRHTVSTTANEVVRSDQKVRYRPKGFSRVCSNTDEIGLVGFVHI